MPSEAKPPPSAESDLAGRRGNFKASDLWMWTTELGCGPPHRRMPCSVSIAIRTVNTVVTFQVNKFQARAGGALMVSFF